MKSNTILIYCSAVLLSGVLQGVAQPMNTAATTPSPAPNYSQSSQPLPDGVIAWDSDVKAADVDAGQDFARFNFNFTNVSASAVTILSVRPSCGCTTAELPPVPWTIQAGSSAQIKVKVNLAGKSGTLFKSVNVATDKGKKTLSLRINIAPTPGRQTTQMQSDTRMDIAKVDRQAVFKGDCASCHLKDVQDSYGKPLYDAACGICHEANPRATMVPDLHHLPVPATSEFWRNWITSGRVGTLMPAFASSQGGPLNDAQINSLVAYLSTVNPSP